MEDEIKIHVYDYDRSKDEFLGQCNFIVKDIVNKKASDGWFTLEKRSKKTEGNPKLHIRATFKGSQEVSHSSMGTLVIALGTYYIAHYPWM